MKGQPVKKETSLQEKHILKITKRIALSPLLIILQQFSHIDNSEYPIRRLTTMFLAAICSGILFLIRYLIINSIKRDSKKKQGFVSTKNKRIKGENIIERVNIYKSELGKKMKFEGNIIVIPKDATVGDKCVIKGKGYKGENGGKNGDLIYIIDKIK